MKRFPRRREVRKVFGRRLAGSPWRIRRGGVSVTSVEGLQEQNSAALGHRQIADLIHYQEYWVNQGLQGPVDPTGDLRLLQRVD